MAAILTAEDVVRRIAAECAYVDERGGVGIRLEPPAAIVRQYGEQFSSGAPVQANAKLPETAAAAVRSEFSRPELERVGRSKDPCSRTVAFSWRAGHTTTPSCCSATGRAVLPHSPIVAAIASRHTGRLSSRED